MNWAEAKHIKLYTEETPHWMMLPWESLAAYIFMLRKVDYSGAIDLNGSGMRGLAAMLRIPLDVLERALPPLIEERIILFTDDRLFIPDFLESQRSAASERVKKKRQMGLAKAQYRLEADILEAMKAK